MSPCCLILNPLQSTNRYKIYQNIIQFGPHFLIFCDTLVYSRHYCGGSSKKEFSTVDAEIFIILHGKHKGDILKSAFLHDFPFQTEQYDCTGKGSEWSTSKPGSGLRTSEMSEPVSQRPRAGLELPRQLKTTQE